LEAQDATAPLPKTICTKNGLGFLEGGIPYIQGWPKERKPVDMANTPTQTLAEAASWCQIASHFELHWDKLT